MALLPLAVCVTLASVPIRHWRRLGYLTLPTTLARVPKEHHDSSLGKFCIKLAETRIQRSADPMGFHSITHRVYICEVVYVAER